MAAKRKFRQRSNFILMAASVFVIVAVVNVFSYRHFARWDLTANRDYTIAPATREVLARLSNIISIRVYLSKDLPAALLVFERQLRDILAEFDHYGKGKLQIEFVAPDSTDQQAMRELQIQGVQPQVVGDYTRDQATQKVVFNSVVIEFQGQKEVIPSLIDRVEGRQLGLTTDFEYLLTSKIAKLQRGRNHVVGWFTNNPKVDMNRDYGVVRQDVQGEWDLFDVRLDPPARIRDDLAVLVVVSPRNLTEAQLFEIDQYVMRGGKLLVLADSFDRSERSGGIEGIAAQPTNFADLLRHYGLELQPSVILDRSFGLAPMGRALMPYPYWIFVRKQGFNPRHRAVANLAGLTLPWTQPLSEATTKPAGVQFVPLASTSPFALTRFGARIPLDPGPLTPQQWQQGSTQTVVAALTGRFPSYFPEGTPYPHDTGTTQTAAPVTPAGERAYVSPETQILVVGNSLFCQSNFLDSAQLPPNHNRPFVMNAIEWLAEATTLGQIRARLPAGRPIEREIPDWKRTAYKALGTFAAPVLIVIGGVFYNVLRRRRRRAVAFQVLHE